MGSVRVLYIIQEDTHLFSEIGKHEGGEIGFVLIL